MDGIFYKTKSGNLGVSVDEGETLFNHVGRQMPVNAAWDEVDAEWSDLSEACAAAAEKAVARMDAAVDNVVRIAEEKELRRKAAEAARKAAAEERRRQYEAWAASPEGKRRLAAESAWWSSLARNLSGRSFFEPGVFRKLVNDANAAADEAARDANK